jgi:hypothetical protein
LIVAHAVFGIEVDERRRVARNDYLVDAILGAARLLETSAPTIVADGLYALTGLCYTNTLDQIGAGQTVTMGIAFVLNTTINSQGAFTGDAQGGVAAVIPVSLVADTPTGTVITAFGQNYDTVGHDFFFAGALQQILYGRMRARGLGTHRS